MKKFLSILLVVALCTAVIPLSAAAFTDGDWEYSVKEGKATISKYLGNNTQVVVPSEIDGCPVTALSRTFYENKTITSVVISEGIETIGNSLGTFESCSNLVEVQLPQSLIELSGGVFKNCHKLKKVNLPKNLAHIGGYCFSGTAVEEFVFPASVEYVGLAAFINNSSLTTVVFEGSPKEIVYDTFRGCSKLTKVVLPQQLATIPQDMFAGCASLTDITLPNNLTKIDHGAFEGCSSLKEIHLPKNVTKLTDDAFKNCRSLESVTLSTSMKTIDWHVFFGCESLSKIIIPGSVEWMKECDLGIYEDKTGEQRIKGFTIVGFEGSVAHEFAQYHGFNFEPINENGLFGDLDDDGKISANDALIALKITVGSVIPGQVQTFAGDVSADGAIGADDALQILKFTVGKLKSFY